MDSQDGGTVARSTCTLSFLPNMSSKISRMDAGGSVARAAGRATKRPPRTRKSGGGRGLYRATRLGTAFGFRKRFGWHGASSKATLSFEKSLRSVWCLSRYNQPGISLKRGPDRCRRLCPRRGRGPGRTQMNYRNLDVYKLSIRFLPLCTELSAKFGRGYGPMLDQLRRASLSICLNIAEGSGKSSGSDQARFYAIARGSAMECGAIVDAALALSFIGPDKHTALLDILDSIVRMLSKMVLLHRS